jgi:adenylate cyclase
MLAVDDQIHQVEQAIAVQEIIRPAVGDALVEPALGVLRAQLSVLHARLPGNSPNGRAECRPLYAELPQYRPAGPATTRHAPMLVGSDRKQVTILFADLANFTAISERHDIEVIRELQIDLFEQLAAVIHQYEGFVEKFVGDAILAVFGAPLTHHDDCERALRAALAMRERMVPLNKRWGERLGDNLALHAGINTGMVVAGYLGSALGGAYMVTGDVVNTAARLQHLATPGQILVGNDTYCVTRSAFGFQALEPTAVKGKREPLAAFELLGAHAGQSSRSK